jgi:hypothetical protein
MAPPSRLVAKSHDQTRCHWNTRSTIGRWAHVIERIGLAWAGGACGLFVAALVARLTSTCLISRRFVWGLPAAHDDAADIDFRAMYQPVSTLRGLI